MAAFVGTISAPDAGTKKLWQDPYIVGEPCVICDILSDLQKEMPSYKI